MDIDQPVAKFSIAETFKITGRGLVFLGQILEGFVLIGNMIEFRVFDEVLQRQIMGVEFARKPLEDPNIVGLLIKCKDQTEIDFIRSVNPSNQVATIYKADQGTVFT